MRDKNWLVYSSYNLCRPGISFDIYKTMFCVLTDIYQTMYPSNIYARGLELSD